MAMGEKSKKNQPLVAHSKSIRGEGLLHVGYRKRGKVGGSKSTCGGGTENLKGGGDPATLIGKSNV